MGKRGRGREAGFSKNDMKAVYNARRQAVRNRARKAYEINSEQVLYNGLYIGSVKLNIKKNSEHIRQIFEER